MVRISEYGERNGVKIVKLEGRVAGLSVPEVESYCQAILAQGLPFSVDMAEVSFLDRKGINLFRELSGRGVQLLGCSPFVNELLKPAVFEIR